MNEWMKETFLSSLIDLTKREEEVIKICSPLIMLIDLPTLRHGHNFHTTFLMDVRLAENILVSF